MKAALRAAGITLAAFFLSACATVPRDASDAPESRVSIEGYVAPANHAAAIAAWRRAEDINAFIGARFEYDRERAIRLSETQRSKSGRVPIHEPAAFFASPRGVCVDVARFAVETLRAVEPAAGPKYLMIEFEPVAIAGNTLRLHWLASYRRDGKYYFFADSKRPGHVAGPYDSVEAFIADYELYRGRKVVRHRELESYERKLRQRSARQEHERSVSSRQ